VGRSSGLQVVPAPRLAFLSASALEGGQQSVCQLTVSLLTFFAMNDEATGDDLSPATAKVFLGLPADRSLSPHLEADGVDELSASTFRAFIATARLHGRLMTRLISGGSAVHPGQLWCLRVIAGHDGITQRELAEQLYVARPTVTKMLQGMERAGLVERRDDEHDQRLTRVHLTDRGRDFEAKLRHVAAAYVTDTIGRLPEADRRELTRLLTAYGQVLTDAIDQTACAADGDEAGADLE
jgi:DNA-binding MarR family transcriptional regulator